MSNETMAEPAWFRMLARLEARASAIALGDWASERLTTVAPAPPGCRELRLRPFS